VNRWEWRDAWLASDLSPGARFVLFVLMVPESMRFGTFGESNAWISEQTGRAQTWVKVKLREAKAAGWIVPGGGGGARFSISIPADPQGRVGAPQGRARAPQGRVGAPPRTPPRPPQGRERVPHTSLYKEEQGKQQVLVAAISPGDEDEDRKRAAHVRLREALEAGTEVRSPEGFARHLEATLSPAEVSAALTRENPPTPEERERLELVRASRSATTKAQREAETSARELQLERERLEDLCAQQWLKTASPKERDGVLSEAQRLAPRDPEAFLAEVLKSRGVDLAGLAEGRGRGGYVHTDAHRATLWPSKEGARPTSQTGPRSATTEALTSKGVSA